MATKFLYMDEQYIDLRTFRSGQASVRPEYTSLTGVLIPSGIHSVFRARFYALVADALGTKITIVIPQLTEIHASRLFPEHDDITRFSFLEGVVKLSVDMDFHVYRVGYYNSTELKSILHKPKDIVGLCFGSLLQCLQSELEANEIWPVMETDRSTDQDRMFAGQIQTIDYLTAMIGKKLVSVDNSNLGELHYSTKRSAYGTIADSIAYLLDARFLKAAGYSLTPFKERLAEIALGLERSIVFDEIIELQFNAPPSGYVGKGPYRYMSRIQPKD
jgi:hypothetical protein